jgi:hypothetical protein
VDVGTVSEDAEAPGAIIQTVGTEGTETADDAATARTSEPEVTDGTTATETASSATTNEATGTDAVTALDGAGPSISTALPDEQAIVTDTVTSRQEVDGAGADQGTLSDRVSAVVDTQEETVGDTAVTTDTGTESTALTGSVSTDAASGADEAIGAVEGITEPVADEGSLTDTGASRVTYRETCQDGVRASETATEHLQAVMALLDSVVAADLASSTLQQSASLALDVAVGSDDAFDASSPPPEVVSVTDVRVAMGDLRDMRLNS